MRYFTSDLHLAHPFVAATRGFWKPGMRPDRDVIETPDGIVHLYGHTHGKSPSLKSRAGVRFPSKGSTHTTGAPLVFCPDAPEYRETGPATAH